METLNYHQVNFLKSAYDKSQFPPDTGAEVAFAGRSNAGKSSALNTITASSRLAKTSKTPGRTQLINFFELDTQRRLVDLPGYGYAKVPVPVKLHWERLLAEYMVERQSLKGIILLMDIRHPLKPLDWQMIEWSTSYQLPLHILLTKADKYKRNMAKNVLMDVLRALSGYEPWVTVQLFSAFTGEGVIQVHEKLDNWLSI